MKTLHPHPIHATGSVPATQRRSLRALAASFPIGMLLAPWLLATAASAQSYTKTEIVAYHDNDARWIQDQVASTTDAATGQTTASTDYDPVSALTLATYAFGKRQASLTHTTSATVASGQLGTLSAVRDGRGNLTTFSTWKRGIPQGVAHADGTTRSAVVDDAGWITTITDENGYATGYGYDALGRLTAVDYPRGDSVAWAGTQRDFGPVRSGESRPAGIVDGQWRLLEKTGDHTTATYYDALLRPVIRHEYDAADMTGTLRAVLTEYDAMGRIAFQSYPSADPIPPAEGIWTHRDALGRVTRIERDSEHGRLVTRTEYLPGLKTRVTNPRGLQVVTAFMTWDEPIYDLPVASQHPEGKTVEIVRHPQFGWPLELAQRNADATQRVRRHYVYDAHGQLCKTIEPETGAVVTSYDEAGNPAWTWRGLDLPDPTQCNHDQAWASGLLEWRRYDVRNRVDALRVADGRGNQNLAYTADGLLSSITTFNDVNDGSPVVNTYGYNARRLLVSESVGQPGWYTWSIGYGYDRHGNLSTQTYPTGLAVSFTPNALGQPTRISGPGAIYASQIRYHAGGGVKQYSYGNGIVHSVALNTRQLPSHVISSGGVLDLAYAYDANGNVSGIVDGARDGDHDRLMTYDDLDRLVAVQSCALSSDCTQRFGYDVLDNLTSSTAAGKRDYAHYVYDARNRLTGIRDSNGATVVDLAYDRQGNLRSRNGQIFDFDHLNRLRSVSGQEGHYRYDGRGHRVLAHDLQRNDNITSQYSSKGQLVYQRDDKVRQALHHIYLGGSLIAIAEQPLAGGAYTTKFQHTDVLGSPVAVTDAQGRLLRRDDYEPFGANAGEPTRHGVGYTGHVMDGSTGLVYMQQRYYDPAIGRFLSVDPIAPDTLRGEHFNRYGYANNNPYRYVDPDGRAACPTGSGNRCIDSPRTETGTTVQPGPTPQQQEVDAQVRAAARSSVLSDGTRLNFNGQEQGFRVSAAGTASHPMQPICQRCADGSTREGGIFNVPGLGTAESGGHTHHIWLSGLPGPEDGKLSRATGRSAYMISERGAFSIEKTEVGYRIRVIHGATPTEAEKRQMRSTIDNWNKNQGGSGVSCSTTSGGC